MAIAPLEGMGATGPGEAETPELPWPRPQLQLVTVRDPDLDPDLSPAWDSDLTGDDEDLIGAWDDLRSWPGGSHVGVERGGAGDAWGPFTNADWSIPGSVPTPGVGSKVTGPVPVASSRAVRLGLDVADRRRRRATARGRRRRLLTAATLVVLVVGLALPLQILGGRAVPTAAGGVPATVYVVRPGDTVSSIATRFAGGSRARTLAVTLVKEAGSDVVVPGEHLVVP